jgi:hypothetical protein
MPRLGAVPVSTATRTEFGQCNGAGLTMPVILGASSRIFPAS